ncbi:MAG: hypothetical protein WDW38_001554 [Sanguina aurantia]
MGITAISIVGQQNNPLFLRTYPHLTGEQLLKYHYIVHCSLDAFEERVLLRTPGVTGEASDTFLGLLYPTEECKAYGLLTNTQTKFVLVLDDKLVKEDAVGQALKRIAGIYVNATQNPFHVFGQPLTSSKFEQLVDAVVLAFEQPPSLALSYMTI